MLCTGQAQACGHVGVAPSTTRAPLYTKRLPSTMQLLSYCLSKTCYKKKTCKSMIYRSFAERMRFELTIQLPIYYLSRVAPSTTRAPLYIKRLPSTLQRGRDSNRAAAALDAVTHILPFQGSSFNPLGHLSIWWLRGANIAKRIFNPNPGPNQMLISPLNGLPSISTHF